MHNDNDNDHAAKGASLSRGPALIVGGILLAFGMAAMINHSQFPSFGAGFPDGSARGGTFLGIEVNGWTNWVAAVAGGLLMFGAAQHALAKLMSLIVGGALAACAVIALVSGDILGLGAANLATVIGLAAAAAVLLVNTLLPRVGGNDGHHEHRREGRSARVDESMHAPDAARDVSAGRRGHSDPATPGS